MNPSSRVRGNGHEILCGLLAREQEALRLLLRRHGGKVKGWLRKNYAGLLNDQELDAVLNEATFNVWQHIDSYDPQRATLGAWFVCIAHNAAIDMIRRVNRHRRSILACYLAHDPVVIDGDNGIEPSKRQLRLLKDFEEQIERLPPSEQRIIKADLAASDGTADAGWLAKFFGIPKSHVYVYRSRARKRLRVEMQKRGYFRDPPSNMRGLEDWPDTASSWWSISPWNRSPRGQDAKAQTRVS